MKCIVRFAIVAVILSVPLFAADNSEQTVVPKTESVSLFKNGFTVVQQTIPISAAGLYRWEDIPAVIHGTFCVESDLDVEIQTTYRQVSVPLDAGNPLTANDLVGKEVTVSTNSSQEYTGKLVSPFAYTVNSMTVASLTAGHSLTLQLPDKHYTVICSEIKSITTKEPVTSRTEKKPVMLFNVTKKSGRTAGTIRLLYLTKGVTWAPSYRVNLLNDKKLQIEQTAVIRNGWKALDDAEIFLVSGFPQIETASTISLLNPSQTLHQFFAQLSQQPNRNAESMSNRFLSNSGMMVQQIQPMNNDLNDLFDLPIVSAGEGPDVHYHHIGKKTLAADDTLSLTTGKEESDYVRILSCDLSDKIGDNKNNIPQGFASATSDVFDVLQFENPLPFPMTTAPVMITDHDRFLGQSQTFWVNPKQQTSVKVTKVMNVSVNYSEELQIDNTSGNSSVGSLAVKAFREQKYAQTPVTGTIEIVNRRNESVMLHLASTIIGIANEETPLRFDTAPKRQTLLPYMESYPNVKTRLFWELPLQAGEKKTLTISATRWIQR